MNIGDVVKFKDVTNNIIVFGIVENVIQHKGIYITARFEFDFSSPEHFSFTLPESFFMEAIT